LYADTNNLGNNAGYIVKELKANREQSNQQWGTISGDHYREWYVKPKIRIPIGLPNNTAVCRIEVFNWDSSMIRSVEITVKEFKDQNNNYDGQYMDEYYFEPNTNILSAIKLNPGEICPGPQKEFWNWNDVRIKTDYRVYWYGQCDMWIDYVRVENLQAKQLFEDPFINAKIVSEVKSAMLNYDDMRPNNFYQEEFEFNTNPCRKRVVEIINSVSEGKLTLMPNLNAELYNCVVPHYELNAFTASDIEKYLIDYANLKILVPTSYCLEGSEDANHYPTSLYSRASLSPNTLPVMTAYHLIHPTEIFYFETQVR